MLFKKANSLALTIVFLCLVLPMGGRAANTHLPFRISLNHQSILDFVFKQPNYHLTLASLVRPAKSNVIDPTSSMISINIETQPVTDKTFVPIDLKHSFIRLQSQNSNPQANWNMDAALIFLAKRSESFPIIAGIEVDSQLPLSASGAKILTELSKKTVAFSAKFQFAKSSDWVKVFESMRYNKQLLTTIYGSLAARQLQSNPELGSNYAKTNVAFSHFFTTANVEQPSVVKFWDNVAKTSKKDKHPNAVVFMDSGEKTTIDYAAMVSTLLEKSGVYLTFIGGDDVNHFVPVNTAAKSLTVWRVVNGAGKGFPYERSSSPEGLYLSLGMDKAAFDIVKWFAERAQLAASAGVNLFGDAEDNFHTYGVLLDFANTVVIDENQILIPPGAIAADSPKLNMIVYNPTRAAITQMLREAKRINQSISDQQYLGIFDYSDRTNRSFYKNLANMLVNPKDLKFTFNANNKINLGYFRKLIGRSMAQNSVITRITPKGTAVLLTAKPTITILPIKQSTPKIMEAEKPTKPALEIAPLPAPQQVKKPSAPALVAAPIYLNIVQETMTMNGKEATVFNVLQPDGTQGLVASKGETFDVILKNRTSVPVAMHWHGVEIPNTTVKKMAEREILPGKSHHYRFKLDHAGTYWIHARSKQQEQNLLAAPVIIYDPANHAVGKNVTVMLQDYPIGQSGNLYLANRHTMENPQTVTVLPGQKVKLRLINAAAGTAFWVSTGKLKVVSTSNNKNIFPLGLTENKDIVVTIPETGGAFPIIAQAAGTKKQTGVILVTPDVLEKPHVSEVATKSSPTTIKGKKACWS